MTRPTRAALDLLRPRMRLFDVRRTSSTSPSRPGADGHGLVEREQPPHSVLAQKLTRYLVLLPPRVL